jgi:hypothetical protein
VSALVAVLLVGGLKLVFPLLQLGFLWRLAIAAPLLFAYLFLVFLVHAAVPEHIDVRCDQIRINHGQSTRIIKTNCIRSARIVVFAPDRMRLRITFIHHGVRQSRTVGIRPTLDLQLLSQALPVGPTVWDARHRFTNLQRALPTALKTREP